MNNENQMREELLQQNGIEHKTVPPKQMKTYQSGFWLTKLYRAFLILLAIVLWITAAVSHIVFSVNAFILATLVGDNNPRIDNDTIYTLVIACFSEPFIIAAAGILTYYIYSTSKHGMMKDIQKRLIELEDQLSSQTNHN